jgi:hypothetical protein
MGAITQTQVKCYAGAVQISILAYKSARWQSIMLAMLANKIKGNTKESHIDVYGFNRMY